LLLTDELMESLEVESPQDWLDSAVPFFGQKIKLQRFGYNLFEGVPTTFAPATDIPVPNEYRLGPGDTIEVQLFGKENRQYSLIVNRDGTINFPGIGPVNVMGEPFQKLKQAILDRVAEQLIGTSAAVTMGSLRSIQVLVLGDARRPASYTVSGLSTITNALFVSGGVSESGSLRNIQLIRDDQVIATLDLYDLLLRGRAKQDVRLESGDAIFIPPVGPLVGVGGFVKRPAIYELKDEFTVDEIIDIAGGLRPDAYPQLSRVERIDEEMERSFLNLDLTNQQDLAHQLQAGDVLLVPPVLRGYKDGVQLMGHVERPGIYEWVAGMRLTDLLPDLNILKPQADLNYILIRRETHPEKRIKVLSADLAVALSNRKSSENVFLEPRDQISVFIQSVERPEDMPLPGSTADEAATAEAVPPQPNAPPAPALQPGVYPQPSLLEAETAEQQAQLIAALYALQEGEVPETTDPSALRSVRVAELLQDLERQAGADMPFERVTVSGEVRVPGAYPFEPEMRVDDLIRAGGGFTESAYPVEAELTRYEVVDGLYRSSRVIMVDIDAAISGDVSANILLLPSDFIAIRRIQNWEVEKTISMEGEVRYPGSYTIKPGDTLSSVIARAGGLTDQAFPQGGIFLRESLREREQEQINSLRDRLQGELASLALQQAGSLENSSVVDATSAGSALLATLRATEATGRLVIDLPAVIERPGDALIDVILQDGDRLLVPPTTQAITVLGEVQFPTSHLFVDGMNRDGYIGRSGGLTPNGAKKNIYLVRANGAVLASNSRSWFSKSPKMEPGDTIVVPLDTQKGFRLQSWASVTTIVYNLAIAVAAINGLSN
ncbi:MAG: SLBB domain-containing protein, partial [Gammaproteobacteria bacterium]